MALGYFSLIRGVLCVLVWILEDVVENNWRCDCVVVVYVDVGFVNFVFGSGVF